MSPRERLWKIIFVLVVIAVIWFIAGENSKPSPSSSKPVQTLGSPNFVCHPRIPAEGGECIRQGLEYAGKAPATPANPPKPAVSESFSLRFAPQCVDISVYQGVPNFADAGVLCVIIQTNDGGFRNPLFRSQVQAAKRAGIPWGVYSFLAPGESGEAQVDLALSMSDGLGRSLGVWADAEVSGAYEHACSYTARARVLHVHIEGVYSSPGLWPGYRCDGYAWPAEWGTGPAYPLAGYPYSEIVFRQWCGTCTLGGIGEVDRDEDLGLIALSRVAPKPKPTPGQLKAQLARELHRRAGERSFLTEHHCRQPPWHAARPNGHWEHACHVELRHGRVTNKIIADLKAKSI